MIMCYLRGRIKVTQYLDRNDYIEKMNIVLSDLNTYTVLHHDPTRKLIKDLNSLLQR